MDQFLLSFVDLTMGECKFDLQIADLAVEAADCLVEGRDGEFVVVGLPFVLKDEVVKFSIFQL